MSLKPINFSYNISPILKDFIVLTSCLLRILVGSSQRMKGLWSPYSFLFLLLFEMQDNVFVTVVASVQYRALADKASDAFYKLSNTRSQIQAYVFDGMILKSLITVKINFFQFLFLQYFMTDHVYLFISRCSVIRASVPKLNIDDAFEQKNEIAKAVEDELEKVIHGFMRF